MRYPKTNKTLIMKQDNYQSLLSKINLFLKNKRRISYKSSRLVKSINLFNNLQMSKLAFVSLFLLLFSFSGFGQSGAEETYKEMFLDGEFFLYEEDYVDALSFYQRLYKRGYQDNANINYRIGICYLNMPGQKAESIAYFLKAAENASNSYKEGVFKQDVAPLDVYAYLGNAYRVNDSLDKAIQSYEKYKSLIDEKQEAERKYADQQIKACLTAREMFKSPMKIKYINAGNIINSGSSNYNPVVSANGKAMAYMFELPFYHAVYYSEMKDGKWTKPRNITPEIQSDGDLYTTFLSADGMTLLFSREDAFNSDIWISTMNESGKWNIAKPIHKKINTKFWESHASLTPDGKQIYFASNRNNGYGQMDIYVSTKLEDNEWSEPENVGKIINTDLNEDRPIISNDGKLLYYSSQGHNCMGGYDIFYSVLSDSGTWSKPVNMGYPLNTTDDEVFYYPGDNLNKGYVARIGEDSYGKEDIYEVQMSVIQEKIIAEVPETMEEELVAEEIPEPQTEQEPVSVTEPESDQETTSPSAEREVFVESEPVKQEKIVHDIKPILFAFNSVDLSKEAQNILDKIIIILNENPEAKIELNGYTDSKGNDEINKIISQRRAEAARVYLIRNGIGNSRISIKGYGNTGYIAINSNNDGTDNPTGRKYNRRVEINFSSLNENVEINKVNIVPSDLHIK